ncbi:TetR/AcrR family transcriptional regulator [Hyphomonas sp.]|uniref:TetR/AcrR family transcriptional regulator n=1 Tax=Hyphomonas sp. TaxID=87 RepID=UPI0035639CA9
MTKTIEKNSPRAQARCEQILDAATACFVEQGFHGAGMARIAEQASMSAGHIYHYFDGKDAIIAAIVDRENGLQTDKLSSFKNVPPDALRNELVERAEEGVRSLTDPFKSALSLEIIAEAQRNPAIAERMQVHDAKVRAIFAELLRDHLQLDNVEGRVDMLFTLFDGLAIRMLRHPDLDPVTMLPFMRASIMSILAA